MDAATAGTIGFFVRLVLHGRDAADGAAASPASTPRTLAVGGAVFAVVFGLAAQQTLGNVIAGLVLISAQPFRVGDRVRLQAGGVAGQIEGVVASHGLLYTTLRPGRGHDDGPEQRRALRRGRAAARAERRRPARAPAPGRQAERRPDADRGHASARRRAPSRASTSRRSTPTRSSCASRATPDSEADGPRLADEILAAISSLAQEGHTAGAPARPPRLGRREVRTTARSSPARVTSWSSEPRRPGERDADDVVGRMSAALAGRS